MAKSIHKANRQRSASREAPTAAPKGTAALNGGQENKVTSQSNQLPSGVQTEMIRARAHSKWEAAGCPAGDGFDFWLEAEREINSERSRASASQE